MCMSHEQSMFCNDHYINIIVFMLTFIQVILDLNPILLNFSMQRIKVKLLACLKYVIFYTHACKETRSSLKLWFKHIFIHSV